MQTSQLEWVSRIALTQDHHQARPPLDKTCTIAYMTAIGSRPILIISMTVGVGPNSYGQSGANDPWHFFDVLRVKSVDATDPRWSQSEEAALALLKGIRSDIAPPPAPPSNTQASQRPSSRRLRSLKTKLLSRFSKSPAGQHEPGSSDSQTTSVRTSAQQVEATINAAVKYYKLYSDESGPNYLPGMRLVGWEVRTEAEQRQIKEDLAKPGFIGRFQSWVDESYPGRGEHTTHQTLESGAIHLSPAGEESCDIGVPIVDPAAAGSEAGMDEWWGPTGVTN